MAFELYGMLAGNVSSMTGEHIKPAYGGEEEVFLRKVVTPIYNVIAQVSLNLFFFSLLRSYCDFCFLFCSYLKNLLLCFSQESRRCKGGKSKHSQWRNYDDLNEYFW